MSRLGKDSDPLLQHPDPEKSEELDLISDLQVVFDAIAQKITSNPNYDLWSADTSIPDPHGFNKKPYELLEIYLQMAIANAELLKTEGGTRGVLQAMKATKGVISDAEIILETYSSRKPDRTTVPKPAQQKTTATEQKSQKTTLSKMEQTFNKLGIGFDTETAQELVQFDHEIEQMVVLLKTIGNQDYDPRNIVPGFNLLEHAQYLQARILSIRSEIDVPTNTARTTDPSGFFSALNRYDNAFTKNIDRLVSIFQKKVDEKTVKTTQPSEKAKDGELNINTIPPITEVHKWIDELFKVAGNPTKPIHFDKEAFEHNPSPRVQDIYTKWTELQIDAQTLAAKDELPVGYWDEILLIKSKIGYYNLYYDVQEPNGANNHQKIMTKILDGNAFQYGPLVGGQDKFDHLMEHFGLTKFKRSENGEVEHIKGDATDEIRATALDIFADKYLFVCKVGNRWVNRSEEHGFRIGRMGGGRYGELKGAVRTGNFEHNGEQVFLVEKKKLKKHNDKLVLEVKNSKGDWESLNQDHLFKGIDTKLYSLIPADKRKFAFSKLDNDTFSKTMRADVFNHAWNLILLDLVDIAFIPKRARGSSISQGNENLVGGSMEVGAQKVASLTDALSCYADINYEINNKATAARTAVDAIILYKPQYYETSYPNPNKRARQALGPKHPSASSNSPYRVTRFARETLEYYLNIFETKQIFGTGTEFSKITDIENDPVPAKPSVDISKNKEGDRLFWHFDFDPNQPAEFPSLSMALQRRYIDSTGAYYTALEGYLYMRNTLFEDLPEKMKESEVKEKMTKWLSSGAGKYKVIKGGVQPDWIQKTTRVYFTRLLHAYGENTPHRFKNWGQLESLVFETVRPLWDATTVKDMSGSIKDFNRMKIDLILDLFEESSTRSYRLESGANPNTVKNNRDNLEHHLKLDDEEELFNFLKKTCGFKVNNRFFAHNRLGHIIWYNKWMWNKSNFAAPKFRKVGREVTKILEDWGKDPKHKPVPPRLLIEKGEKS